MIKKAVFLAGSNGAVAILGLARNILVARLVGVEEFGIASTFAITMFLVEMSSDLALNRFIVQDRDGENRRFQSTLQSVFFIRGLISGLVLYLAAGPIAYLFDVPEVVWAYQLFAVVPVLRGAINFDMFRFQREMRFGPQIAVELCSAFVATTSAILMGILLKDYRAMLYSIILQQVTYLLVSHLVAERRYSLGWSKDVLRRMGRFGWPLLLNGLLMFLIFHGDRIVVGSVLGMTDLGWFSAAVTLTMAPTLVLSSTFRSFMLPRLSASRDDPGKLHDLSTYALCGGLLMASGVAVFFFLAGPGLVWVLYGQNFAPALAIIVSLGLLYGCRIIKTGSSIVAISRANTTNPLSANVLRGLFVPIAWVSALYNESIAVIIFIGIAGEACSAVLSVLLLKRTFKMPLQKLVFPALLTVLVFVIVAAGSYSKPPEFGTPVSVTPLHLLALLALAGQAAYMVVVVKIHKIFAKN